ncbi:MAG: TMEM175 family protein [bacterium]|nr:TMEM175 family protein [bacterium]
MKKGRMEAFSDGVIAIIITIMVLELKTPLGSSFSALGHLIPVFVSYILSFIYIGIYWNNHHHLVTTIEKVSGGILWANLHLLFWLSLVPFVTAWMGQNQFASETLALYGFVMLMAAVSYFILQSLILKQHGPNSALAKALGSDLKGKVSLLLYLIAIPSAFISHWISGGIYVFIALMWLVPDKRIERMLK